MYACAGRPKEADERSARSVADIRPLRYGHVPKLAIVCGEFAHTPHARPRRGRPARAPERAEGAKAVHLEGARRGDEEVKLKAVSPSCKRSSCSCVLREGEGRS